MTDCEINPPKVDIVSKPKTTEKSYLVGPCATFKRDFQICMSNSDDNVITCQKLKGDYEKCIEKHFTNK